MPTAPSPHIALVKPAATSPHGNSTGRRSPSRRAFRDLPVAAKLTTAVAAAIVAMVASGVVGVIALARVDDVGGGIYEQNLIPAGDLAEVDGAVNDYRATVARILIAPDEAARQDRLDELKTFQAQQQSAWDTYAATDPTAAEARARAAFLTAWAAFQASASNDVVAVAVAGDIPGAARAEGQVMDPLFDTVSDALSALDDIQDQQAAAAATEAQATYEHGRLVLIASIVVGSLAALTLAWVITRGITRPLHRTLLVVEGLAEGRLDQRVEHDSRDEVGRMVVALNRSLDTLTATMATMAGTAQTLSDSSQELTSVATQLSAGAEESATQSQVVSAATEQISANIGTVAAAGEEMTSAIREIATATSEASATAATAVAAAGDAGVTIERLGASSREIGDVVKLITTIAEQTNLLALNATIEAARAGEAGKGFAVVAGEVKELAQQTARATEEITTKVNTIQADAVAAKAVIAQVGEVISRIDGLQSTIAAAVEEQSATTAEMVRNVTEVATGAQEISANIAGVAAAAAQTTSSAQHTATGADDVARAAVQMQNLVGSFRY